MPDPTVARIHPDHVVRRSLAHVPPGLPDDVCWEWRGTLDAGGYGVFSVGPRGAAKQYRAHRVALELAIGRLLEPDEESCHRCDNPPCVNPRCLFPGTKADNQHDKRRKGRAARGTTNRGGGKLTAADVRVIRGACGTFTEIGRAFGVSRVAVAKIKKGKLWGWLE